MQMSMFDGAKQFKIDKPIRLVELFGGIGAQAKALENLGVPFEHYRMVEIDKYAVKSYNAIHGANFTTSDITKISGEGLGITETDKYCYLMTYSFPCTDLSAAGRQAGMKRGGGTRSGLLWEVERLLKECKELPQVLVMENVPQVIGKKDIKDFSEWINFLDGLGYHSKWQILNAKDYGIPQNRERCFMVSILGDYFYEFPKKIPLNIRLKHVLESNADEKYYLSEKGKGYILKRLGKYAQLYRSDSEEMAKSAITAKGNENWTGNFIMEEKIKCEMVGMLCGGGYDKMNDCCRRVYSPDELSPTVTTCGGGNTEPKIIQRPHGYNKGAVFDECPSITTSAFQENNLLAKIDLSSVRIRKLTSKECYRLMGFADKDFEAAQKVNSNTQLYKQAGNSIVTTCLMAIFGKMLDMDHESKINEVVVDVTTEYYQHETKRNNG